ncbi:MAG: hypothetical protein JO041_08270 [Acidobacteria bacterium]|nr:hypothetical protein [Acidobacteriota bacterium]
MDSCAIAFSPENDAAAFAAAPAAPAVFALFGSEGAEPYVSRSANLRRRLMRILGEHGGASKRLSLRGRVARIEFWLVASEFETQVVLYRVLRAWFRQHYRERLRFRPAPVIKLDLRNPYPRACVTARITGVGGPSLYYGPFASRAAAEKFLNDSLDLFRLRRCPDDLHPDPAFPGCIYSEMKMCLAPCFRGCSDEAYAEEARRVRQYLDSGGESLRRELEAERDRSSSALEFEAAAAAHQRLEKAGLAAAQMPELARRIDQLNGLAVMPSIHAGCVRFFPIARGLIAPDFDFPVSVVSAAAKPVSMEARIREALDGAPAAPKSSLAELEDSLALLKRWYFRSQKAGELFLASPAGELPMRKIVRGIARVLETKL